MLLPVINKRVPVIVVVGGSYNSSTGYTSITVAWPTKKISLFKYNGNILVTGIDLGSPEQINDTQWNNNGVPLPQQSESGETDIAEEVLNNISEGDIIYCRVRVGRCSSGWGQYGYLKHQVAIQSSGSVIGGRIFISESEPPHPKDNDIWFDLNLVK